MIDSSGGRGHSSSSTDPNEYLGHFLVNHGYLTELELTTKRGTTKIPLEGKWFPDGFRGTLGEFLRAIEEDREPSISGRNNLASLELCFAALASADTGRPVKPGAAKTGRL